MAFGWPSFFLLSFCECLIYCLEIFWIYLAFCEVLRMCGIFLVFYLIELHLDSTEGINVCAGNLVSFSCAFNSVASFMNLEFHITPGSFVQLPGTVLVATIFSYRLAYLYIVLISRHFPHYSFLPPIFTPRYLQPLIFFSTIMI